MTDTGPISTPRFIDNRHLSLAEVLQQLLSVAAEDETADALRIATAFFSPSGFGSIADRLAGIGQVRLLLGADSAMVPFSHARPLGQTQVELEAGRLNRGLDGLEKAIRTERDRQPFALANKRDVRRLEEALARKNLEVRRYEKAFLHAKAYIFSPADGQEAATLVGSSNLTAAGLKHNLELNLGVDSAETLQQAEQWFDQLWEEAEPYDLAALYRDITPPLRPWDIYIRVLWQLYGKDVEEDRELDKDLPLTKFQYHGVARVRRLISQTGGAVVADEVGLGKTFIAGEILKGYLEDRQQALILCPAALRENTWGTFLSKFQVYCERLSYEQLANDRQLRELKGEAGGKDHLQRPLAEYQLVIVDEAHNYRNPKASTLALTLKKLLDGKKRDLLLLTATPVNNSLWDLYHLLTFFIRQDARLSHLGVRSIYDRFKQAMAQEPSSLNPDLLYPIIDATTVKRTRGFVQKHYTDDKIEDADGQLVPINFPSPKAISVRYQLDNVLPGFFDELEAALDPGEAGNPKVPEHALKFARYMPGVYLTEQPEAEEGWRLRGLTGLLRSGLLKRFESSVCAFRNTLSKMVAHHEIFLSGLDEGYVLNTELLNELSGDDDAVYKKLEDIKDTAEEGRLHADNYKTDELRQDVEADLKILNTLLSQLQDVEPENDSKLAALADELRQIAEQAKREAIDNQDESQRRKVLVFSYFEDTAQWIADYLQKRLQQSGLDAYADRMAAISSTGELTGRDEKAKRVAEGFAPLSMGDVGQYADKYDLLITTDVLAEGVNLQQCRHIINYDMPWNPMRLVQRHGRIDRIGSPHKEVFMRTFFPEDRLDRLLELEKRIRRKLDMAAASIGQADSPIQGAAQAERSFTESREEIDRLMKENPELYERGGTASAAQTSEEYRQTLRQVMEDETQMAVIKQLPWKVGSGMAKGSRRGVFFCAVVGSGTDMQRNYLRFVPADDQWQPDAEAVESEIGTCLRLIECEEDEPRQVDDRLTEGVYAFWEIAQQHIYEEWSEETDPRNLQPRLRPLHREVIAFIRDNTPAVPQEDQDKAVDILSTPWQQSDWVRLKAWFDDETLVGREKAAYLVEQILGTGLLPLDPVPPLPHIERDEIQVLCWLALEREQDDGE